MNMAKKDLPVDEHFLVPNHRVLSEEEKAEMLKKYSATEKQLPKISPKDPMVKVLGAKVADVIEITRPFLKSEGTYLYYRVVA